MVETIGMIETIVQALRKLVSISILTIIGFAILFSILGWIFGGSPSKPIVGVPTTIAGRASYGQWPILDFNGGATSTSCDCEVTYTCRYNMGWDEICDNQRWGIDKVRNGQTVYHPLANKRALNAKQAQWRVQRIDKYRTAAQVLIQGPGGGYRCQVDEFPMGNLKESGNLAPQVCRLFNGPANQKHGGDYSAWKTAQWKPCSTYRSTKCNIRDGGPPATWAFGPLPGSRGAGSRKHFIDAYGFDEQTANSLCWATYTYTDQPPGTIATSTPVDHGFRVLDDDPMYGNAYGWPRQSWRRDPAPVANYLDRPYGSQPVIFQRGLLANDTSPEKHSDPAGVCHADLRSLGNGKQDAYLDLDYDNLLFVDLDGKPVDGRTCNIIYEDDDPHSEVHIVLDEKGKVVDMYMGDLDAGLWIREAHKSPNSEKVTVDPTTVTVTTGVLAGSESRPTFPASTTGPQTRSGSVVTPAPFAYRH
ncbi:hypothetical protein V501_00864 [Pseudogymnoascus sp. VKM F-4519 (FW-2642)]|nr:hypothetical protein V501_00864 [Pseudogymnoascus sp. VKM F-4519 (FW-2642)]